MGGNAGILGEVGASLNLDRFGTAGSATWWAAWWKPLRRPPHLLPLRLRLGHEPLQALRGQRRRTRRLANTMDEFVLAGEAAYQSRNGGIERMAGLPLPVF